MNHQQALSIEKFTEQAERAQKLAKLSTEQTIESIMLVGPEQQSVVEDQPTTIKGAIDAVMGAHKQTLLERTIEEIEKITAPRSKEEPAYLIDLINQSWDEVPEVVNLPIPSSMYYETPHLFRDAHHALAYGLSEYIGQAVRSATDTILPVSDSIINYQALHGMRNTIDRVEPIAIDIKTPDKDELLAWVAAQPSFEFNTNEIIEDVTHKLNMKDVPLSTILEFYLEPVMAMLHVAHALKYVQHVALTNTKGLILSTQNTDTTQGSD